MFLIDAHWPCKILILILIFLGNAYAATTNANLTAKATIVATCNTPTATTLAFPNYNPAQGTALTATSTITVYCTLTTPFSIALDVGTGGGSFTNRLMKNGTNTLSYNLYTSSAYTTVWGDGTNASATVSSAGTGLLTANPITVYGKIAPHQYPVATSYSSIITVTLTY